MATIPGRWGTVTTIRGASFPQYPPWPIVSHSALSPAWPSEVKAIWACDSWWTRGWWRWRTEGSEKEGGPLGWRGWNWSWTEGPGKNSLLKGVTCTLFPYSAKPWERRVLRYPRPQVWELWWRSHGLLWWRGSLEQSSPGPWIGFEDLVKETQGSPTRNLFNYAPGILVWSQGRRKSSPQIIEVSFPSNPDMWELSHLSVCLRQIKKCHFLSIQIFVTLTFTVGFLC